MSTFKESFSTYMAEETQKPSTRIILSYKDYDFIRDDQFQHSDEFKTFFNNYASTVKVPGYLDWIKTSFKDKNKIIKIEKNNLPIGYVMLERDADSCYVTPYIDNQDFDCLRYLVKHVDINFLRRARFTTMKHITLYFISYNQQDYDDLYQNNIRHFATEFYKEIKIGDKPKNDLLFTRKDKDGTEYKFIDAHNKFDSNKLIQLDKEFFTLDSNYCEVPEAKYRPSRFDFIIKIQKNDEDIGYVGFDFKEGFVLIAPYLEESERDKGLYSYLLKHIDKCTYLFPSDARYLAAFVPVKNKASIEAHNRLFDGISFKTFKKDI